MTDFKTRERGNSFVGQAPEVIADALGYVDERPDGSFGGPIKTRIRATSVTENQSVDAVAEALGYVDARARDGSFGCRPRNASLMSSATPEEVGDALGYRDHRSLDGSFGTRPRISSLPKS